MIAHTTKAFVKSISMPDKEGEPEKATLEWKEKGNFMSLSWTIPNGAGLTLGQEVTIFVSDGETDTI